jgi:hypothetical protein
MALRIADVRPDPVLTEIAMQYGTGGGFATDQLLPTREVASDEFKFMSWSMRDYLQGSQFDSRRAPGDQSSIATFAAGSWDTGTVHERSLKLALEDEVRNNAPNGAIYEAGIIRKLMNALRIEVELEYRDLISDTGTISNATPAVKWDAAADVVIETNIDVAREAFMLQCGFEPNYILFPPAVSTAVKRDSTIRDLRKYTDPSLVVDGGLPPTLWGLNVVVPGALQDTANPGASASIARVWNSDKAILLYVDPSAATDPQAMTSVMRFASAASVGENFVARSWRDSDVDRQQEWYQVMAFDELKLVADCAYILNDVLT